MAFFNHGPQTAPASLSCIEKSNEGAWADCKFDVECPDTVNG
jgi:hypothetical protein